jgi:hypothetical protein
MHEPEPEPDMHLQSIGIPSEADVGNTLHLCLSLFDVSKYKDPLHILMEYIAQVSRICEPSRVRKSL